ncbi:hypothetical protein HY970_02185 [Candidatus Kaiserbacteria bacterium]|nr:hypothetical protein [Candidatus Kaiserbacteria bacterium]
MSRATIIVGIVAAILFAGAGYYFEYGHRWGRSVGNTKSNTEIEQKPTETNTRTKLIGTWRSAEDSKFTREFKADGTSIDRYEGEKSATQIGSWEAFTSTNPDPGISEKLVSGITYIKIEGQYEVLFFSVVKINDAELELNYLDRGNTLRFTRVR